MIRSSVRRLLDHLFVLRPALLVPVWTVYLRGAAGESTHIPRPVTGELLLGLLMLTCVFGAVNVFNQVHDIETDRINGKGHFLTGGLVTPRTARAMHLGLSLGALLLAVRLGGTATVMCAIIVALGVVYSAPPLRLKDHPFGALAANVAAHGFLAYLVGFGLHRGIVWGGIVDALPYAFAVGAVYLLTTVPDVDGDRRTGKRTLAVHLGAPRAARWALGWYWCALLSGLYTLDVLFLIAAVPTSPLYLRASRGSILWCRRAILWSVGLLSLCAAVSFPAYLPVLAAGWALARWYYRARLQIPFP